MSVLGIRVREDNGHLLAVLLCLLAMVSTVAYGSLGIHYPIPGGGEPVAIANNVAKGAFANPFEAGDTGPSAFLAPVFPLFIGVLKMLFGSEVAPVAYFITLLMHGLHAALLPAVSRKLFGQAAPGYWAAGLQIALPLMEVFLWEAIYIAVGILVFYLYADRVLGARARGGWLAGAGLGALAALLLLTNPVSLLVFGPWVAALVWRRRNEPAIRLAAAVAMAAMVVGCVPWTVRNYLVFDRFVPIRDNFGHSFYASNNDCAAPSALENMRNGCHDRVHPIANGAERDLVRQLGEVEYNRNRQAVAFEWVRREPRRFLALTAGRVAEFWFPQEAYSYWLVTILGLAGAIVMVRGRTPSSWVLLAVCLLYPLVYYLSESNPRYRYPILWVSLLQASYALAWVWTRVAELTGAGVKVKPGAPPVES